MKTPKSLGKLTAMMITTATPLSCSGGPGGSGDTVLIPSPCKSYVNCLMPYPPSWWITLRGAISGPWSVLPPSPSILSCWELFLKNGKSALWGKIRSVAQLIAIIVQTNHIAGASPLVSSLSQLLVSFLQSWAHLVRWVQPMNEQF